MRGALVLFFIFSAALVLFFIFGFGSERALAACSADFCSYQCGDTAFENDQCLSSVNWCCSDVSAGDGVCNYAGTCSALYWDGWGWGYDCQGMFEAKNHSCSWMPSCSGCCTNDCSSSVCSDNDTRRPCASNYDADSCLDWGPLQPCGGEFGEGWDGAHCHGDSLYTDSPSQGTCSGGNCRDPSDDLLENCNNRTGWVSNGSSRE